MNIDLDGVERRDDIFRGWLGEYYLIMGIFGLK